MGFVDTLEPDARAEFDRLPDGARVTVERLGMAKIPHEGPWFLETWRSPETLGGAAAARYPSARILGTAILAVITHEAFSAMHRLRTDELWHFHAGSALELVLLGPGGEARVERLGLELDAGALPQRRVPAGTWMGARPVAPAPDGWALIGNTLAPGFEYEDYEPGERAALETGWPEEAERIRALTRGE